MHPTASFNMRLIILLLLGISGANAATHSLRNFYTIVSGDIDFPEFTIVGLVDGQEFIYFDSNNKTVVPKTEWMKNSVGADYWNGQTQIAIGAHQLFKVNIQVAKDRFNQSKSTGVHIFQYMYGCQWDEETGYTEGIREYGYDGDDFLVYDMKTFRWIAPKQPAEITQRRWNKDPAELAYYQNYITKECVEWLKKYVNYGENTLKRTVHPSVSLLQKSPSSPVTCQATGFYPRGVMVFWRRDGEVFEDVEHGDVLPNQDGTFQKSVHLNLTVRPEDLDSGRWDCVVQLSGVKEDFVTKLERSALKTNHVPDGPSVLTGLIIGGLVALLLVVCIISAVVIWKKKTAKKGFTQANTSEDGSQSSKTCGIFCCKN